MFALVRPLATVTLSLVYANTLEWAAHRWLLHGWGKKKDSPFAYHWHYHHREVRSGGYYDRGYERSLMDPAAHRPEALGMIGLAVAHVPLLWVSKLAFAALSLNAVAYVVLHRQSHLDPRWARRYLPWHYDHHMAPDQDANWCVTFPLMDHVFGTRVVYVDTAAEHDRRASNDGAADERSEPTAVRERSRSYQTLPEILRDDLRMLGENARRVWSGLRSLSR